MTFDRDILERMKHLRCVQIDNADRLTYNMLFPVRPISIMSNFNNELDNLVIFSKKNIKGIISPFLFLKENLFELYGICTVALIIYKNISTLLNAKTLFFARRKQYFRILATTMETTMPISIKQFAVYGAFVT